jgi:hypothetical protein
VVRICTRCGREEICWSRPLVPRRIRMRRSERLFRKSADAVELTS